MPKYAIYIMPTLSRLKNTSFIVPTQSNQKKSSFIWCQIYMIYTPKGPNYDVYMIPTQIGPENVIHVVPTLKGPNMLFIWCLSLKVKIMP